MRKLTIGIALAVAFSAGAVIGMNTTTAQAGPCFYKCICSVPHKCCSGPNGTSCKPDPSAPIGCPQIAC
jgi:hypothetical protein